MAAAYLFHIIKNHPFIDGNKRTGLFAAIIFLELNNCVLALSEQELFDYTMAVATSRVEKEELIAIFKNAVLYR